MKYLAKMIDDVIRTTAPMFEEINKVVTETAHKVEELYMKQVSVKSFLNIFVTFFLANFKTIPGLRKIMYVTLKQIDYLSASQFKVAAAHGVLGSIPVSGQKSAS